MAKSKTCPGFFVVHMPKLTSHRLVIPTAFIARIGKVVPAKTMLRNRLGRLWQVEVVKTDTSVYFLNGWEKFLKDNSVNIGEFIVFQYNGECIFYFKILGIHGCEKEDARASTSIGKRVSFLIEEKEEEGKSREKQKQKVIIEGDEDNDGGEDNDYKEEDVDDDGEEDEDEDDDDEHYVEEEDDNDDDDEDEEEEDDNDDDDEDEEEEDDNDDDDEEEDEDDDDDDDDDDNEDDEEEEAEQTKACGRCCRKKGQNEETKPVTAGNYDGIDVERYVDPKNPYFVTRLLDTKNNTKLYVPTGVITDFKIQVHPEMEFILHVPNGRDLRGKVTIWKDGRVWIRGWTNFCKWNMVAKDDICICEFMQGRGNVIQVHIVRAGQT